MAARGCRRRRLQAALGGEAAQLAVQPRNPYNTTRRPAPRANISLGCYRFLVAGGRAGGRAGTYNAGDSESLNRVGRYAGGQPLVKSEKALTWNLNPGGVDLTHFWAEACAARVQ